MLLFQHNMRLPILALTAAAASASAATVFYNNTASDYALVGGAYSPLLLQKFDSSLGTLTGVSVTVNSLTYKGSFTVTTTDTETELFSITGRSTLRQAASNDLGFTQIARTADTISPSPGTGTPLPFGLTTFTFTDLTVVTNSNTNIDSSFWSAYTGTGDIAFEVRANPLINVQGSGFSTDSSNFLVTADMTVTYTYTPVPEPSTYGMILGGLALAGAALRRRQKAAK